MTASGDVRWLAEHVDGGQTDFRIGAVGDDALIAEWVGVARLITNRAGSSARFEPLPEADDAVVRKVRNGSAAMLLRHLKGELSMHGAAIAIGRNAIIITGRSGQGKSTLAALMTYRGAGLLSDDVVAIDECAADGWQLQAVEAEHWLDSRAQRWILGDLVDEEGASIADDKQPIAARVGRSQRLGAIVELAFAEVDHPRLVKLAGIDAAAALIPQLIRFAIDEPQRHKTELDRISLISRRVPIFRLERPRGLCYLNRTTEIVASLLPAQAIVARADADEP